MKGNIDIDKVMLTVLRLIKYLEIDSVVELGRTGLEEICAKNNIDYSNLTEAEKKEIWKRLVEIVEEIEFVKQFEELY